MPKIWPKNETPIKKTRGRRSGGRSLTEVASGRRSGGGRVAPGGRAENEWWSGYFRRHREVTDEAVAGRGRSAGDGGREGVAGEKDGGRGQGATGGGGQEGAIGGKASGGVRGAAGNGGREGAAGEKVGGCCGQEAAAGKESGKHRRGPREASARAGKARPTVGRGMSAGPSLTAAACGMQVVRGRTVGNPHKKMFF
ncbi:glycine-rich cell wall structural protein-like [Cryptomeria japonica]|uniref:glycine-rich cell wall structural protein-like n=1 Tax=Cryptomeria japonica TaxID=3369 RepID=UPI0027DA8F23|nr:glycine-rich cell wall structural protein-like [Cryptomeria japonica]